ncbi:SBF-like CPA transporter family-domain-containing protein [Scenedesmus sp. NREL 46B-D3]|nr:SBF-like CPA transporter family-domain-containing protein [Scenedesmus sp. NREL 46B-D3]
MLLSFSFAAALAMAWPLPGKAVASWTVGDVRVVQAANNFLVFLISGLTLKSDDFRALMRHWVGVLYGLAAILAITPCLGFGMLALPLQPPEFATGLALFCVVPTTLGVGVALTAACKGNQALALLLTVATNLLGIVTVPYELRLVLSTGGVSTVSVEPGSLVVKLLLTVLAPSVMGKLARDLSKPVQRFVTRHKIPLSLFSTLNLACIVWQTLSGARQTLLQQPEAAAVLIMSSQKSAPVAVTVITYLTPSLTQQGLMAIPCILGQLAQIFIGSALAKWLRGRADKGL